MSFFFSRLPDWSSKLCCFIHGSSWSWSWRTQGSFRPFNGKRQFITINRSDKEIGMCSDGARVNMAIHWVVKEQIGQHYMLVLCPNHKIELAIHDAFDLFNLKPLSEINLRNVYYLFSRANLRWRLFKRQAVFQVSFINVFF